jgi:hypothetical protein
MEQGKRKLNRWDLNLLSLDVLKTYHGNMAAMPNGFTEFYTSLTRGDFPTTVAEKFIEVDWSNQEKFHSTTRKCAKEVVNLLLDNDAEKNSEKMTVYKGVMFLLDQPIDSKMTKALVLIANIRHMKLQKMYMHKSCIEKREKVAQMLDSGIFNTNPEFMLGAMELFRNAGN